MSKKNATVLVVDDEETIRSTIASILKDEGYEVIEAEDGYQALEKMRFNKIDVITSDLKMPQLSGLQLLRVLRSMGYFQTFIIISGYGTRQQIVELLRLGAFDFLDKPFDPENLCRVVAQAANLGSNVVKKKNEMIESLGFSEQEISPTQEQAIRQLARLKTLNRKKD